MPSRPDSVPTSGRTGSPRRGWIGGGVIVLLAGGGLLVPAQSAVSQPEPARQSAQLTIPAVHSARTPAGQHAVTLLTGDQVVVGPQGPRVVPAAGRRHIRFVVDETAGRLRVVPSDVAPMLAAGRLDRRLFDITGLIRAGHTDTTGAGLPLIVRWRSGAAPAGLRRTGLPTGRSIPVLRAVATTQRRADAAATWRRLSADRTAERIWLDGRLRPSLEHSMPQIGVPAAHRAGLTGSGVVAAVLDTGVDDSHPDLSGRVAAAQDFTGEGPADEVGHGTHVAATLAGSGAASGGLRRGAAPDVRLLSAKVCLRTEGCPESAIIAGMEWAVARGAKVVNLSLGGPDTPDQDPLEQAVAVLSAKTGALFVIAAGNDGELGAGTVGSPASADAALAVGAVDRADRLAAFSGRGPRVGDGGFKPDLLAPGVGIVAARARDTAMGEPVDGSYTGASGTSMAAPHVAGAAVLLAQRHPGLGGQELKALLMGSARELPGLSRYQQGAGRVDVERAIRTTLFADTVVRYPTQSWPHHDDTPQTRTIGYRNLGDAPVELRLTASLTAPDGKPAPAGALRTAVDSVVVPARGSVQVGVVSDTRHDGPDGSYTGQITATAGDLSLHTAIVVDKEVESYHLTIRHLDRDGAPAWDYLTSVLRHGDTEAESPYDPSGTVRIRLPRGSYRYMAYISTPRPEVPSGSLLVRPVLTLDRDTELVMDARLAGPVSVRAPVASARSMSTEIMMRHRGGSVGVLSFDDPGTFVGQQGPRTPVPGLLSYVSSYLAEPAPDGSFRNTPYLYAPVWFRTGSFYTGVDEVVRPAELATVATRITAQVPDRPAVLTSAWSTSDIPAPMMAGTVLVDTPRTVTRHLATGRVQWRTRLQEAEIDELGRPTYLGELRSGPRSYAAGRHPAETWNRSVFAPAPAGAVRSGDRVEVDLPPYADQDGRPGWSIVDSGSTRLYAGDALLAQSAVPGRIAADLPATATALRLEVSADRRQVSELSTELAARWTFRAPPSGPLPLWTARFRPAVDEQNRVRSARQVVPVVFAAPPGSRVGALRRPAVEVSVDDGRRWTAARVIPAGRNRWLAVIDTAVMDGAVAGGASGFVSLRTRISDSAGNRADLTVLRAYRLPS